MKKIVTIVAIALLLTSYIKSQTVDSIKVVQTGDFIKINYKILNSTPDQLYRVKVLCSIYGGMNTELRSISGDVGDMVAGGKPDYWVVWDVLKDVDEIKSVEFIVRVELVKDLSESSKGNDTDWSKLRTHITLLGNYPGPKPGIGFGYMGSWGFFAKLLYGNLGVDKHWMDDQAIPRMKAYSFSFDLTKRIIRKNTFQIHLMTGPTITNAMVYYESTGITNLLRCYGFNLDTTVDIKRSTISVGFTKILSDYEANDDSVHRVSPGRYLNVGLGIKF